MPDQRDIWMALEEWKAHNQQFNNRPSWQVDQFSEGPAHSYTKPGQALVRLGRNLTALGIWLQNRYGDSCLIQVEVHPQSQTSRC